MKLNCLTVLRFTVKKLTLYTVLFVTLFAFCRQPERDYSGECGDVKKAYDDIFRAYTNISSEDLPDLKGGISMFEWSSQFNDAIRNNPQYSEVVKAVDNFDQLLSTKPSCESELN